MAPPSRRRGQTRLGGQFASRDGPQLPAALLRDMLGGGPQGADRARHAGPRVGVTKGKGASRKEQRRMQRLDKKASRAAQQSARIQARRPGNELQERASLKSIARPMPALAGSMSRGQACGQPMRRPPMQPAVHSMSDAKPKRLLPQAVGRANKRTRFEELLPGTLTLVAGGRAVNSEAAYMADLRAAREAEKKLGIKKGGALKGPADGLSALLSGLSSASGGFVPSYLSPGLAAQAKSLLAGKGKSKGAGADSAGAAGASGAGLDTDSEDELGLGVLKGTQDGSESESEEFVMEGSTGSDEEGGEGEEEGELGQMSDEHLDTVGDDDSNASDDEDASDVGQVSDASLTDEDTEDVDTMHGADGDLSSGGEEGVGRSTSSGGTSCSDSDAEGQEVGARQVTGMHGAGGPGHDATQLCASVSAPAAAVRYVPPALRAAASGGEAGSGVERRVTGLLNRLAEVNLSGIAKELGELYSSNRRQVVATITAQMLQASVRGPRATPAFATTAAALVAGVAGSADAPELAAGFLEMAARQLEAAVAEDDSLSSQNLIQLLASCHAAGIVSTDLMYGLLHRLVEHFTEHHVMLMVTLLNARGLALRSADPSAMHDLVLAVSAKVAAVSQASGGEEQGTSTSGSTGLSTRARMMLELVIDIKNNRTTKAAGGPAGRGASGRGAGQAGGTAVSLSSTLSKWLRSCSAERVAVRNISWDKLLLPNKKGMWWLPEAGEAIGARPAQTGTPGTSLLAAGGGEAAAEAAQLLKLATAQRMNTDARRAVFVAIMGAADVVHAHERLLRLPLKGDQQREVVRVVVDCCLHEAVYNPFYALLVGRLAADSKAHRLTTQFCMWDQYKELGELSPAALTHLARLNAGLVARDTLPITSIKVVDLGGPMDAKSLFFWRLFFQHLIAACSGAEQVVRVFSRAGPGLGKASGSGSASGAAPGALRSGLLLFLRTRLGPWLAEQDPSLFVAKVTMDELLVRLRHAEATVRGEDPGIGR